MTVKELKKTCIIDELHVQTEHGWVTIKPKQQAELNYYHECDVTDVEAYAEAVNTIDGEVKVVGRIRVIAKK